MNNNNTFMVSDEDIKFLKRNRNMFSIAELAEKLGRSKSTINRLKLKKEHTKKISKTLRDKGIGNLTIAELKATRKKWKHAIRQHASKMHSIFKPECCEACTWKFNLHLGHIKEIKDFSDDSLVKDINSSDNIIWLCPNHHNIMDDSRLNLRIWLNRMITEHSAVTIKHELIRWLESFDIMGSHSIMKQPLDGVFS